MSFTAYIDWSVHHSRAERDSMLHLLEFLKDSFDDDSAEDVYLLGWPLLSRLKEQSIAMEVEHDFIIISQRILIVGDFKDYSGSLLDGDKNVPWMLKIDGGRDVPVRGGSQGNPFRQLDKNANDIVEKIVETGKKHAQLWGQGSQPSFPRLKSSLTQIVLFSGEIKRRTDRMHRFLAEHRHFYVFSMVDGLPNLRQIIASSRNIGPAIPYPLPRATINMLIDAMGFDHHEALYSNGVSRLPSCCAQEVLRCLADLTVLKWAEAIICSPAPAIPDDKDSVFRVCWTGPLSDERARQLLALLAKEKCARLVDLSLCAAKSGRLVEDALADPGRVPSSHISYDNADIRATADELLTVVERFMVQISPLEKPVFPFGMVSASICECYAAVIKAQLYESGVWDVAAVRRYWSLLFSHLAEEAGRDVRNTIDGVYVLLKTIFDGYVEARLSRSPGLAQEAWVHVGRHWAAAMDEWHRGITLKDRVREGSQGLSISPTAPLLTIYKEMLHDHKALLTMGVDEILMVKEFLEARDDAKGFVLAGAINRVYGYRHPPFLCSLVRCLATESRDSCPLKLLPLEILRVAVEGHPGDWRQLPAAKVGGLISLLSRWQEGVSRLVATKSHSSHVVTKNSQGSPSDTKQNQAKVIPSSAPKGKGLLPFMNKSIDELPLMQMAEETETPVARVEMIGYLDLREHILEHLYPLMHPEEASKWGDDRPGGILLYGPPGCGKTRWAQWIAQSLGWSFSEVPRSEFGSPYVDGAMGRLSALLASLREKAPTVIFFDEFDSVARDRKLRGIDNENAKVVNTLLQDIPKQVAAGNIVVAATNYVSQLDPAVVRPGRFDLKIAVFPPLPHERREILVHCLSATPPDAPFRSILRRSGCCDPMFWSRYDVRMYLFGGSHIDGLAKVLRKAVRQECRKCANESTAVLDDKRILAAIDEVRAQITEGDIDAYRNFCAECSLSHVQSERLIALQKELDVFTSKTEAKQAIGFRV